jgi:hypothetical protein
MIAERICLECASAGLAEFESDLDLRCEASFAEVPLEFAARDDDFPERPFVILLIVLPARKGK